MQGLIGIILFCGIAWAVSENRRRIEWRVLAVGLALQFIIALLLLKVDAVREAVESLNVIVLGLRDATIAGTSFIFGYIGGGPVPFENTAGYPGAVFILAFQALPLVMVVSALTSLLFFWKILPKIVRGFATLLKRTLGIGGAEGLASAANIFVGMVEAPLFIKPYMARLNRSELFVVMTTGMATIAGTMLVVYAGVLTPVFGADGAAKHLIVASIMSAPAAIVIARLMVPKTKEMQSTDGDIIDEHPAENSMDAITQGAAEGLKLWLNIIAMLIVLVALVALVNMFFGWAHSVAVARPMPVQDLSAFGWIVHVFKIGAHYLLYPIGWLSDVSPESVWSLEGLLGWIMRPLVWAMGVPWADAQLAGEWMGTKVILNEFLAYDGMARFMLAEQNVLAQIQELEAQGADIPLELLSQPILDKTTYLIMSYAMCGFANFGSLGIMLGGLTAMAPERRAEIASLGLRSIVAGNLATMMTGTIVGIIS